MLVLFETPAGYALFSIDDDKVSKPEKIQELFHDPSSINKLITLKGFHKFENTTEALSAMTALVESKPDKTLIKFLKKKKSRTPYLVSSIPSSLDSLKKSFLSIYTLINPPLQNCIVQSALIYQL